MDPGGGPSGEVTACLRHASLQVSLDISLDLSGRVTVSGGGYGLEVFLPIKSGACLPFRLSLLQRFWLKATVAPWSVMRWVLVVCSGSGETLGQLARSNDADSFWHCSPLLEARLRSHVYTRLSSRV
jgi:hypothetical protein